MRANALKAWTETPAGRAANLTVAIHQTLESTHPVYNFGVNLYNFIQVSCPLAHHLYFNYLESVPHFTNARLIHNRHRFQEVICREEPDIVLSTHAHLNHGFFELAKNAMPAHPPRTVTCCGELHWSYGFSRRWVNPEADLFVGAVPETCHAARRLGMPEDRILDGGFLLHPSFYGPDLTGPEKTQYIINELEMDPNRFLLVLGTGVNGANNHIPLLDALYNGGLRNIQILALCSRNRKLADQVKEWARTHPEMTVRAKPFIQNMKPLLQSASALVCRSGTGLTSEAILCQCPIIFNGMGGFMPQEKITLAYCNRHKLGMSFRKTSELPAIVAEFLRNPDQLNIARQRKYKIRPHKTPQELIQHLQSMLRS